MMGLFAYFDPAKSTSGQRFFVDLASKINAQEHSGWESARVVLFNISAPLGLMLRAWLLRKIIVLRVDGLYFDKLSPRFLARLRPPVRLLVRLLAGAGLGSQAAHVANFFNQNWTGFVRMMLADQIVYQSAYSREAYAAYFPRKPGAVVVNGADMVAELPEASAAIEGRKLRLVTIFDEWRPSKRVCELISFVRWVHEVKGAEVELTLLGYTGRFAVDAPEGIKDWVEQMPCFRTLPRFKSFDGEFKQALLDADMYLTLSYRDACPNVVVEAMAHGLPVVGVSSGGIPDIVGDAGVLLSANDDGAFFSASRFDSDFPEVDYEQLWDAVQRVGREQAMYRERVKRRFVDDLGMDVVVARYRRLMAGLGQQHE